MSYWLTCTVLLWVVLEALAGATCLPASWLMPPQGDQLPAHILQQLSCDLPSKQDFRQEGGNICDTTDSILDFLQKHWPILHDPAALCSEEPTPTLPACQPHLCQQPPHPLHHTPLPVQQQHQQQQQEQHWACDQAHRIPATPATCHDLSSNHVQPQHHQCPSCGQMIHPQQQLQQQQQQQMQQLMQALVSPLGPALPSGGLQEGLQGRQHTVDQAAAQKWAWPLLGLQQLWEHFRHDTQVVQQQLDSGAKLSGQSCRSCLTPHLRRSQREMLFEVIALLLLGALCTSALLLAAKMYKRRQSIRRHQQTNISAHRLRQLEKLHLQQQHQLQQQLAIPQQQKRLPQLNQQPISRKHERQKSHESVLPSSPSASSSHSEVIGTAVSSRQRGSAKPSRARSAQQDQQPLPRPVETGRRQLGRSHSDISTEAVEPSKHSTQGMAESLSGSTAGAGLVDSLFIEPNSPTSTAESSSSFLPSGIAHQGPNQAAEPPMSHPPSSSSKQTHTKRRQKHGKKAASKAPPSKRRFIPGLDEEFDEAVHELPKPPADESTTGKGKQKGSVGSQGSSNPSSASSSPLPSRATQPRRQLSVNAAPFVPTGYAQGCALGTMLSPQQLTHLSPQNLPWPLGRCPQQQSLPECSCSYDQMRPPTPLPGTPSHPFSPRSTTYSSSTSAHSSQLDRLSPVSNPWQYDSDQAFRSAPPQSYPKPTPRFSPTSVLPWASESSSAHESMLLPQLSLEELQSPTGLLSGSGSVLLPPVLEDIVSSPFPGMRQPESVLKAEDRPCPTGIAPVSLVQPSVTSALLDLPRQLPMSSVGLPGFSSIWSTSAMPAHGTGRNDTWSSSSTPTLSSIW